MNNKKKESILFLYPTYVCSSNCNFCFIDPKLRKRSNDLSLDEIKNNILYLEKIYIINQLALVGGDPLLYKDFIPLMDYLGDNYFWNLKIKSFVLCTEGLNCSSKKLVNYLSKFFISDLNSCIHISLNNFYPEDRFFKKRKQAILNLAKNKFNVRFVIIFTKNNINKIESISKFINDLFLRYYSNSTFHNFIVELRLPFNLKGDENELFVSHPDYFFKTFNNICNLFFKKNIPFTLRNIPLCYLKKDSVKILDKISKTYKKVDVNKKIVRIDKQHQLKYAEISTYSDEKWKLQKECLLCNLKDMCNGITKTYIKKFKYPKLNPFISND